MTVSEGCVKHCRRYLIPTTLHGPNGLSLTLSVTVAVPAPGSAHCASDSERLFAQSRLASHFHHACLGYEMVSVQTKKALLDGEFGIENQCDTYSL